MTSTGSATSMTPIYQVAQTQPSYAASPGAATSRAIADNAVASLFERQTEPRRRTAKASEVIHEVDTPDFRTAIRTTPAPLKFRMAELQTTHDTPETQPGTQGGAGASGSTFNYENKLTSCLASGLSYLGSKVHETCSKVWSDIPVMLLASGIGFGAQYFGPQLNPILSASSEPRLEGAIAVAKFVGLAFFLKSALQPFNPAHLTNIYFQGRLIGTPSTKSKIQACTIEHLHPMVLAACIAYAKGLPVDLVKVSLGTAGIFTLIKVLNMGCDRIFSWVDSKRTPESPPVAESDAAAANDASRKKPDTDPAADQAQEGDELVAERFADAPDTADSDAE